MDQAVLALALVAGALAAVNPCGFALLPAYLAVLVAQDPAGGPDAGLAALRRAARFGGAMTVGVVATFGLFGLAVVPLRVSLERYLPVVTLVVGVVLVLAGGWVLSGHPLSVPTLPGRRWAPSGGWWSQVAYGVTFALASLTCTVAPFLAVTSAALSAGGPGAVVVTFLAYGVGMATVVVTLALAAAGGGTTLAARVRRLGPVLQRLGGVVLVVAGAYVAWYGWVELRVLSGAAAADPVVQAGLAVQATVAGWVGGLGAGTLVWGAALVGGTVLAVAAASALRSRGRRVGRPRPQGRRQADRSGRAER